MTAIHLHDIARRPRWHAAFDALGGAGAAVLATLHEWRRRSRDRAELASLDWRMLQDIGLGEGEREFLANKPFWRE